MDGAELLQRVRETYAGFETYSDVGTVESPGLPGPGMEFQTQFKRPLKFRFHWLWWHPHWGKDRPGNESTVCSDGRTFKSDFLDEVTGSESFPMMIGGATGISSGSVHAILNMLLPGVIELTHSWHGMTGVKYLDDGKIGENNCLHIIGTNENSDDTEAWIEKDNFLVRRIKQTIVITEAKCAEIRAEMLTDENIAALRDALTKAGLSADMIEQAVASQSSAFEPRTYQHIYDYTSVSVNQPIGDSAFEIL